MSEMNGEKRHISTAGLVAVLRHHWALEQEIKGQALAVDVTARYIAQAAPKGAYDAAIARMPGRSHAVFAARQDFADNIIRGFCTGAGQVYAQIVVIGSGFDALADRLHVYCEGQGVDAPPIFEVDYPAMIEQKRAAIEQMRAAGYPYADGHVTYVPCDFDAGYTFAEMLDQRPGEFNPELPTLFVILGVVYYLPEQEVERMFAQIHAMNARSAVVFDYALPSGDKAASEAMEELAKMGAPIKYLTNDIQPLLFAAGRFLLLDDVSVLTHMIFKFKEPVSVNDGRRMRLCFVRSLDSFT